MPSGGCAVHKYAVGLMFCWCAMQNLVDSLAQHFQEAVPSERHGELNTFVVYNQRSRVTSSAKRKRQPGSLKIHQTPDGSFFDLMRNARDMLLRCGFDVPQVSACISSVQLLLECCLSKSFGHHLVLLASHQGQHALKLSEAEVLCLCA